MGMEDRDYYWEDRKRREALMQRAENAETAHSVSIEGHVYGPPLHRKRAQGESFRNRRTTSNKVTMKGFIFGVICGVSMTLTTLLFNATLLAKPLTYIGYFWRGIGLL